MNDSGITFLVQTRLTSAFFIAWQFNKIFRVNLNLNNVIKPNGQGINGILFVIYLKKKSHIILSHNDKISKVTAGMGFFYQGAA